MCYAFAREEPNTPDLLRFTQSDRPNPEIFKRAYGLLQRSRYVVRMLKRWVIEVVESMTREAHASCVERQRRNDRYGSP